MTKYFFSVALSQALFLTLVAAEPSDSSSRVVFESSEFKRYAVGLSDCQKSRPTLYRPLELLRVDLLPLKILKPHIQLYAKKWSDFDSNHRRRNKEQDRLALSCEANESLNRLVASHEALNKIRLDGSTVTVLQSIPTSSRIALTPLDSVFLTSSEVGKKITKDLKLRSDFNLQSVLFDSSARTINFESNPTIYQIQLSEMPGGLLRVRGTFKDQSDPIGSDLTLRPEYLVGGFFDARQKAQNQFGLFLQTKDVWIDESGRTHFEGDGHNHSHKH